MNSIILDWYRGKIERGLEKQPDDEKYREAEEERSKLLDALMDTLGEEQKERLFALEDIYSCEEGIYMEHAFANGFRLGARLMVEVLDDDALPG